MRVAIIGGTGFVGAYLVDALVTAGHEPALLVRPGSSARVRHAARCRLHEGDIDSAEALEQTLAEADAVIYNVGILREDRSKGVTYEQTQYEGVVRTLAAARNQNVGRMLLMSANGVKPDGTRYQQSKYRAERAAADSGLDVTVFRPSVIFGDPQGRMEFATQLYRDMIRPPLPAVGFHTGLRPARGQVLMSPVHVEDVAAAFVAALDAPQTIGQTYVLGGPDILSWTEMLRRIAKAVDKRKLILPMPISLMHLAASLLDWWPLFPVTREQLTMLAEGNTAAPAAIEELLGRPARPFATEDLAYLRESA